ncbi:MULTISPECIES: SOS-induced cell division inhibitor SulA [Tenebrionibacter/Tenebrionicola group]|jgi:cell division inhibitor SulA|uniref:Cell division inhibitor SulA n=2 Tax=Tenebrionibacter/Tenebrionicola group TaxID=2969848 RepID=A0A8K0V2I6_9ENTR|nr:MULTISPECIES: SOS-induced cell division inhibitor SulA [Tenebrionibacter/Tenebrionicola group]MBK4716289.1 cell division inhibitor SulA [Tenebrionibacter intestinalis]MBV4412172.1 cell division inhibitor SulA [Tenebrionicola larvae]MBV5097100.1 cell division inhibitor SulA [Tenebrionicola larvae]
MYLPAYNKHSKNTAWPAKRSAVSAQEGHFQGLVSEVIYNEERPLLTQTLLLPLLQQLGQQSRWLLWLTPQRKLSREWIRSTGLPLNKIMQAPVTSVETMANALRTGNYSVVIGWLPQLLTDAEHDLLIRSAEQGRTIGFIMRPERIHISGGRPRTGLKIHSTLYH